MQNLNAARKRSLSLLPRSSTALSLSFLQVDLAERIRAERLASGAANGDVSKSHPVAFWNFKFDEIDIRKLKGMFVEIFRITNRIASATVMMPNKKVDAPSIVENHDGTVTVKYQPKVQG